LLTCSKLWENAKTAVTSTLGDKRLVSYMFLLLALHISGVLLIYRVVTEFDIVPHFWFGYVLSEYSSKAAYSVNLQPQLAGKLQNHSWKNMSTRQIDFLLRLAGFLLVGGLFWEGSELAFSSYLGIQTDSFFAFPITLGNIDGAIDVLVGILGAVLAFLVANRKRG